jgi:hypothetical protein
MVLVREKVPLAGLYTSALANGPPNVTGQPDRQKETLI